MLEYEGWFSAINLTEARHVSGIGTATTIRVSNGLHP
jgi:hypothetical protein